jgi:hypothetical protein
MSAGNRDIETAWKYALRYAGEGGHIATLPEIIEAREAAHKSFYGNHHGETGRMKHHLGEHGIKLMPV